MFRRLKPLRKFVEKAKTATRWGALGLALTACDQANPQNPETDPRTTTAQSAERFIAECQTQLEDLGILTNPEDFNVLTRMQALRLLYFAIIGQQDDQTSDEQVCAAMTTFSEQIGRRLTPEDCSSNFATEVWFLEVFSSVTSAYLPQEQDRSPLAQVARYVTHVSDSCPEVRISFPTTIDTTIDASAVSCPTTLAATSATEALTYGDGATCQVQ